MTTERQGTGVSLPVRSLQNPAVNKIRTQYEEGLKGELRYQTDYLPFTLHRQETLLEHVTDMLHMADEIERGCPALARIIDMSEVKDITYVHDAGEIHKRVRDLPLSDPGHKDPIEYANHKRKERAAVRLMTQFLPEPYQTYVQTLSTRYQHDDPNDKEVLLTHWIHKVQATVYIRTHATFDGDQEDKYIEQSLEKLDEETKPLLITLTKHPEAREEMLHLTESIRQIIYSGELISNN